jgi:hypothetical protein
MQSARGGDKTVLRRGAVQSPLRLVTLGIDLLKFCYLIGGSAKLKSEVRVPGF